MAGYKELFGRAVDKVSGLPGRLAEHHDNALKVDSWDTEIGRSLYAESEKIQKSLASMGAAKAEQVVADWYASCFDDEPQIDEECSHQERKKFAESLLADSDHEDLRSVTAGNDFASQIASVSITESYAQYVKEVKEHAKNPGSPAPDPKAAAKEASQDAVKKAEEAMDFANGWDLSDGSNGRQPSSELLKAFDRMQRSDYLQRLAASLGAFRRIAESLQMKRFRRGHERVCGVTLAGELEQILPSELVLLDVAPMLFYAKVAERRALCRRMNAVRPAGRGPMIVLVDESGSMSGTNIIDAKAIAMTLAWIAKKQGRDAVLYGFSAGTSIVRFAIQGGRCDMTKMIDWCEHFFRGGTDVTCLADRVPNDFDLLGLKSGETDLVIITDGQLSVSSQQSAKITDFKKKAQAKLHLISIGVNPGPLKDLCDYHHVSSSLCGQGVEHVLGIGAEQ